METISRATIRLLMPNELILFLKKHKALKQYIDEMWIWFNKSLTHQSIEEKLEMLKKDLSKKNNPIGIFYWDDSAKGYFYWLDLCRLYRKENTQ